MRLPSAVLALIVAGAALASSCSGMRNQDAEPTTTVLDEASSSPSAIGSTPDDDADEPIAGDPVADAVTPNEEGGPDGEAAADSEAAEGVPGISEDVAGVDPAADGTVPDPDIDPVVTGPTASLTGLITTGPNLDQRRAVAVKVGNGDKRSRPQAGLAAADIVYEVLIEGTKTRFLAVFHSEMPGRVGPVRSVRSSDLDLVADLATPYLVSSGANATVLREMRRAERAGTLIDVGGLRTFVPYSRDPLRRPPFNLYFHYDKLGGEGADSLPGGPPAAPVAPLFDYVSPNPEGLADVSGVTVTFHERSGNVVSHVWDAAAGGWVRIQEGALMITETDSGPAEVAPANVVVLWMPYGTSAADSESPQVSSYGSGDALLLTAGTVHEAVWERTDDRVGFRFSSTAGDPLSLSPGSTWLLLANSSRRFPVVEATVLTASEGARLLAEARAAAQEAARTGSDS